CTTLYFFFYGKVDAQLQAFFSLQVWGTVRNGTEGVVTYSKVFACIVTLRISEQSIGSHSFFPAGIHRSAQGQEHTAYGSRTSIGPDIQGSIGQRMEVELHPIRQFHDVGVCSCIY